jgi:hypothetical protein
MLNRRSGGVARALAMSLLMAVLAFTILPSTRSAQASLPTPIVCFVQTFDAHNIGTENYFWEALNNCDQPVDITSVGSWLFEFHWNDSLWYPTGFLGGNVKANEAWLAKSGVKRVEPNGGYHCVQASSLHFVGAANHIPPLVIWPSLTYGQCY